jgi:hypothetical protein
MFLAWYWTVDGRTVAQPDIQKRSHAQWLDSSHSRVACWDGKGAYDM